MSARKDLQERYDQVCAEIRGYPTPIARCDLHLAALLDERSQLLSLVEKTENESGCSPAAIWTNDGGLHAA